MASPLDLIVLISGRGSNMLAIHDACQDGRLPARIALVIADRPQARGLTLARERGLTGICIDYRSHASRTAFERSLADAIDGVRQANKRTLIVLAGFMRILEPAFVMRYQGAMLNIHPSLLPLYRGLDTHARALAEGHRWHGASVHFVTPELDGGPVVAQIRVPVLSTDTAETLSARVQRGEHRLYWRVIDWIARNRLQCSTPVLSLDGKALTEPVLWQLPEDSAQGDRVDEAH